MSKKVFIGTDSGATTTKLCAVWEDGEPVSNKVLQRSTSSENGRGAVIESWIAGVSDFLAQNNLDWSQVAGVGLAIPGPYERYGVFSKTPNLPASFSGWDVFADYSAALAEKSGRRLPLVVGNDGNYGGVAEARLARGNTNATVMMLMAFVSMATRWPVWKPVTWRPQCICSVLRASPSVAAADATGAAWRLTQPFPAFRNCSRKR
jgi:glucokinase